MPEEKKEPVSRVILRSEMVPSDVGADRFNQLLDLLNVPVCDQDDVNVLELETTGFITRGC